MVRDLPEQSTTAVPGSASIRGTGHRGRHGNAWIRRIRSDFGPLLIRIVLAFALGWLWIRLAHYAQWSASVLVLPIAVLPMICLVRKIRFQRTLRYHELLIRVASLQQGLLQVFAWYAGGILACILFASEQIPLAFSGAVIAAVCMALVLLSIELAMLRAGMAEHRPGLFERNLSRRLHREDQPLETRYETVRSFLECAEHTGSYRLGEHLLLRGGKAFERSQFCDVLAQQLDARGVQYLRIAALKLLDEPDLLTPLSQSLDADQQPHGCLFIEDFSVLFPVPLTRNQDQAFPVEEIRQARSALLNIRRIQDEPSPGRDLLQQHEEQMDLQDTLSMILGPETARTALAAVQAEKILDLIMILEDVRRAHPSLCTVWALCGGTDDPVRERAWIDYLTLLLGQQQNDRQPRVKQIRFR